VTGDALVPYRSSAAVELLRPHSRVHTHARNLARRYAVGCPEDQTRVVRSARHRFVQWQSNGTNQRGHASCDAYFQGPETFLRTLGHERVLRGPRRKR
jgi:hypothetical protein